VIERAVILSNDGVLPNPLRPAEAQAVSPSVEPATAPTTLKDSERALIVGTLESVGWVVGGASGAAAKLGLKRTTLIHKMKKHGISRPSRQQKEGPLEVAPGEPESALEF
jgi:formate hydrogenlyase transcriptional activator